jgi:hypothetical protein
VCVILCVCVCGLTCGLMRIGSPHAGRGILHIHSFTRQLTEEAVPAVYKRYRATIPVTDPSYVENSLVVTGKDMKRTVKRKPQKSRNRRNSGDQAFDCMEDVQKGQTKVRCASPVHPIPSICTAVTIAFNRSGSMSWPQVCGHVQGLHCGYMYLCVEPRRSCKMHSLLTSGCPC